MFPTLCLCSMVSVSFINRTCLARSDATEKSSELESPDMFVRELVRTESLFESRGMMSVCEEIDCDFLVWINFVIIFLIVDLSPERPAVQDSKHQIWDLSVSVTIYTYISNLRKDGRTNGIIMSSIDVRVAMYRTRRQYGNIPKVWGRCSGLPRTSAHALPNWTRRVV